VPWFQKKSEDETEKGFRVLNCDVEGCGEAKKMRLLLIRRV
jgi:hypothetical protein